MTNQSEALKLATLLNTQPVDWALACDAAAELRRLHEVNTELIGALECIAMSAEAAVCNVEWVAAYARRIISKVNEEK